VRIVAAQALGSFGSEATRENVLQVLGSLADSERHGVLTAMAALSAIESLGDRASSLRPLIAKRKTEGPSPDERYDSYVPRLVANILQNKNAP
jgi:HEAT repeat protein